MITMDFKGITWVGNVYEKFEAMCLEVEEAMYQDTVKYVGNQVQTVGASVKKFYSDVMQDLLPPSSVDPVKASDLSLNPYGDFGIHKKPKAIKEDSVKDDKQGTEVSKVIADAHADHSSTFREFNDLNSVQSSSMGLMKGGVSEEFPEQKVERGSCKGSKLIIRRKSRRNNHLLSEMPRSNTPVSKNTGNTPLCCEISEKHEAVCSQIAMSSCPTLDDVSECNSGREEICKTSVGSTLCTAVASNTTISDVNFQVKSDEENGRKPKHASSNVRPDGLSANLDGLSTNSGVAPKSVSIKGDTNYREPPCDKCLSHAGRTGEFDSDGIENDSELAELELETVQRYDKQNLEETCILVDREKVNFTAQQEEKPRSYKKKIRRAFSTKRSSRKEEYKQLAVRQGKMGEGSNQGSVQCLKLDFTNEVNIEKSPNHGFCESEWELL
ncbi:hypothetical protein NMG60_11019248 [Bertholletia excelsa]